FHSEPLVLLGLLQYFSVCLFTCRENFRCENGGMCAFSFDNPHHHSCICLMGVYEGERCEREGITPYSYSQPFSLCSNEYPNVRIRIILFEIEYSNSNIRKNAIFECIRMLEKSRFSNDIRIRTFENRRYSNIFDYSKFLGEHNYTKDAPSHSCSIQNRRGMVNAYLAYTMICEGQLPYYVSIFTFPNKTRTNLVDSGGMEGSVVSGEDLSTVRVSAAPFTTAPRALAFGEITV
ncbi:unnamed protein product, partial [Nippostrongylus brasiliensis]|uniref:EGF-like domain-containing protein n=1 Tax=Nippostrongylus brasiliensis TaxID=27835 RepID=A0A0N4XH06_NIPBR